MADTLEEKYREKLYMWISVKPNGERDILEGNIVFKL